VLRREPGAGVFLRAIAEAEGCRVSAVSHTEASLVLAAKSGDRSARRGLDALINSAAIEITPHIAVLTGIAREAFLRFGKGRRPAALNFGDCAACALAKAHALPLLFKGTDFSATDIATIV
jgi:ribonuclease VapC